MRFDAMNDRHVVVTGGTGGLGVAVVQAFLEAGASVTVPNSEAELRGPLATVKHEHLRVVGGVDLADEARVVAFYEALPALWASVHLAGGFAMKPVAETSLADLRAMLDLNTVTCFLSCREAVRAMRRTGGDAGGRIVNVTARPALSPVGGMIAYAVSKAGVASVTQSLAAELVGEGILVNAVVPSIIDTPANRKSMPTADVSRWPRPDEIARTIRFLASPDNLLTSGTLVPVYGRA